MSKRAFRRGFPLAALLLLCFHHPLEAGMITFGGDLAGTLGGPITTPATLSPDTTLLFPFSGAVPNVGQVSGVVVLANNADGTAGSVTLSNFQFVSLRPTFGGPIPFTIAVTQDFTYSGLPEVLGSEALAGQYTFTAFPQGGTVAMAGAVNSSALDALFVPGVGLPPFPQVVPIGPVTPPDVVAPAVGLVRLDLFLGASLSDNSVAGGPRVDLTIAEVRYAAVPEPGTLVLSSIGGVLVSLGYCWHRRKGRGKDR